MDMVGERNERGFWGIDSVLFQVCYSDIGFIISLFIYFMHSYLCIFLSLKKINIIYNIYGSCTNVYGSSSTLLNMHLTNLLVFLEMNTMDTEFLT